MKKFTMALLVFSCLSIPTGSEASSPIQSIIDTTPAGGTVEIEAGEYEETIVIDKPLIIVGKGDVLLRSCEKEPVVTIAGEGVKIKNITVEHCGEEEKDTAVSITGSHHLLDGMKIETRRFGIMLVEANDVTVQNSELKGRNRGNGIDLWKSNQNQIENVKVTNVTDGIYLEQSHENVLSKNSLENSRYGMHLMYSNQNVLQENSSTSNITGAMLMETDKTSVRHNMFEANKSNVNAQGLLLYEAYNTEVIENEIRGNRVGVYIEKAEKNQLVSNKIIDNFIGVQFKNANENKISQNTFIGNVNEAQAIESSANKVDNNYWDAASLVDMDGDGKSEIPYHADPYFLTLTKSVPEYQLFFQAPGLILLQNLLKSPDDQLLTDSAPLMEMSLTVEKETTSRVGLWVMSILMIIASTSVFILGRKRK